MASSAADNPSLIMNLVEMKEVRVEGHKMQLPVKLRGTETDHERAITFYATAGRLAAAAKEISAQGRITALASNVNQDHVGEKNNMALFNAFGEQVFDPSNWRVLSFHDRSGRLLSTSTKADDNQVLLPVGDENNNLAANARRQENIGFVNVAVMINLSKVTGKASSIYTLDTFVQLPASYKKVKNSNGNEVTVHTFIGKDDIRKYTAEEFKEAVFPKMRTFANN